VHFSDASVTAGRPNALKQAKMAAGPENDLVRLLADLSAGKKVSLLVAPAAQRHFGDYRQLFAVLRAWGLQGFYNVLRYADIVVWAYRQQLENRRGESLIASACPAVTLHVLRQKSVLQPLLMPVVSPVIAAALYLRKNKAVHESFAFLTPCVCKRQEIKLYGQAITGIEYCVTIRELQQQLLKSGATLNSLTPVDYSDAAEPFVGESLSVFGGIGACLSRSVDGFRYRQACGASNVYPLLDCCPSGTERGEMLQDLLELNHCGQGCDGGAGIGKAWPFPKLQPTDRIEGLATRQTLPDLWRYFDENLDAADFAWPIDQVDTELLNEGRIT
jgi:hypothetical protein